MNHDKISELREKSIKKLLIEYSTPAIIAMTAMSLYNIVDNIFLGHGVGSIAISALAVAFPFMNLTGAFGSMIGVGGSSLLSIKLGRKEIKQANNILGNVLDLSLILSISISIITLIFLDQILVFFGASENTLPYAHDYMTIILYGNVVSHLFFSFNALLRAIGKPNLAMRTTITTVLANAILDPIFIFALDMGIQGAAIATIIAQVISMIWQLKIFTNKSNIINFHWGIYKLNFKLIKEILAIGASPFLMNAAACVIVIFINQSITKYGGDTGIGAYGIINKLVFIAAMIVMGYNQGMQPIAGYNYGAKLYNRVDQVLKLTIIYSTIVVCVMFLICMIFPEIMISIFTSDKELIQFGSHGLRLTIICLPLVGFQMVTSNFFQSINMAKKAIILSLSRQMLILLPLILILPPMWGADGVWLAQSLSDGFSSLIAGYMLWQFFRNTKKNKNNIIEV